MKCISYTGNGISRRASVLQYRYSLWYTVIIIRYKEFTCNLYKNMDRKIATLDYAGQFKTIESIFSILNEIIFLYSRNVSPKL